MESRELSILVRLLGVTVIVISLCISPSLRGAVGSEVASGSSSATSVLRIGTIERPDILNPSMAMTDISLMMRGMLYDSLFSVGEDMESVGNLAISWGPVPVTDPEMVESGAPYGSVWEYEITSNARWHDGEPLTVEDVVWTVNLYAQNYYDFWAYEPYTYYIGYAEAVDSDTVRIYFSAWSTDEPTPVTFGDSLYMPILPKHLLSSYVPSYIAYMWSGTFEGDLPVVGSGPFMATSALWDEYLEGESITLVRNPSYHWFADKGLSVQVDSVVFEIYDDLLSLSEDLESGSLDVAQLPADDYLSARADILDGTMYPFGFYDGPKPTQSWTGIVFNMNNAGPNPSRLDPAVRQALAMGTDKDAIVSTIYHDLASPGSTLISPVMDEWHYEPTTDEVYAFDLEAAAELLSAAGYNYTAYSPDIRVATTDSLSVKMGYVDVGTPLTYDMLVRREHPEEVEIAEYLEHDWAEIGVDLSYRVVDEVTLSAFAYAYNYDTVMWHHSSDPDPVYSLFAQSSYALNGWSENAYSNATYDECFLASVVEMDGETRETYVDMCQYLYYEDVGHIVIAYPHQTCVWRTDTFSGWGDWDQHPGRSLWVPWGASPVFFTLSDAGSALVPYEREGRFSMLVPDGWTLTEDETVDDSFFDLVIRGPVLDDFQTNILLNTEEISGVEETRAYLESQMDATLDELSDMGAAVTTVGSPAYWESDNCSALRFVIAWVNLPIRQVLTIYADEGNGRLWVITCSVHSTYYNQYEAIFSEVSTSFDPVGSGGFVSAMVIAVIVVSAIVAAAAVTVVLYMRRRPTEVSPPGTVGTPTIPSQGMCPECGSPVPSDGGYCPACGRRMGDGG